MSGGIRSMKFVAVGDGAVGKTSLLVSYCTNTFPGEHVPTIFDNYAANVMVDGQVISMSLWDTAGQEDYSRLRPLSYPSTDCFIVCFSLMSRASFENIKTVWIPELRHHMPRTPIVLVGTKADLRDEAQANQSNHKFIRTSEGQELAKQIGASNYIETSSLMAKNIKNTFDACIRTVLNPKVEKKRPMCTIM
eukprot:TRINITY_DN8114_c0_g1_i3.p1 TRINITY_DN8114_c0_g1~~TRINITY_DN8114_c0_g1_i3.p1  ORF type:complete len:192 (+),score=42.49 TRINITY_DN8114_c0_g1_i3:1314-1889(+)